MFPTIWSIYRSHSQSFVCNDQSMGVGRLPRIVIFFLCLSFSTIISEEPDMCYRDLVSEQNGCFADAEFQNDFCGEKRYILYDVNPGEGFNLRRDVYMRIASLVRKLRSKKPFFDWVLVLPPWGPLYHWKSEDIGLQLQIPWARFFDIQSLSRYVPVIEFKDFFKDNGPAIEELYYLQHYAEGWKDGKWEEKVDVRECNDPTPYEKLKSGKVHGWFWGYSSTYAKDFHCLSVQGYSSTLIPLLLNTKSRSIMIDRAEVILHDSFGDFDYWLVRRSMSFAKELIKTGNEFRLKYLGSCDKEDRTEIHENWLANRRQRGSALGGPYVGVHLRRKDFVGARSKDVPNIEHAANQIKKILAKLNLTVAFIATDASESEFHKLKEYLPDAIRFHPNTEEKQKLLDGGVAIVDQWICAHSRYFIGTYESTFSFRIHEEREIMGFSKETTFNRLCGNDQTSCKQPSQWTIVYS